MSQQFPTSAQIIYETLAADATFLPLIGEYRFKNGQGPIPALSIVSAGEDMPSLRRVTGVECIIQDAGSTSVVNYLSGDAGDLRINWSVFLVAWEPAKGSDLQLATNRILRRFQGSSAIQVIATPDGLGSLVQNKIMISSFDAILPE